MITIYAIHVLAAAAWVGGLPPLLFALSEQRRSGPREARDCTLDICSGFSLMAMMAVTLLVLSGIANAGFPVSGSFGKLFGSAYGDVLLKKIALVAAMLVLVREAVMRLLFSVPEYLPQAGGGIIKFY